jgi:hypothetical protein
MFEREKIYNFFLKRLPLTSVAAGIKSLPVF